MAEVAGTEDAGRPVLGTWERRYVAVVAAFTAYVAFWGILFPQGLGQPIPGFAKDFSHALPFVLTIPPLHARFIGALYLAATLLLLSALAGKRSWPQQRVCVWMILTWTAMLELISLMHLDLFAWDRRPVRPLVAWWLAYTWFPLQAAWILWRRRDRPLASPAGEASDDAPRLRLSLDLLALVCLALAALLFLAPQTGAELWPWKLPPALARIYSGPFLALAVGAAVAARAGDWAARAGFVWATLSFALVALAASFWHRQLFSFDRPASWIWFGGLALAAAALMVWGVIPAQRTRTT